MAVPVMVGARVEAVISIIWIRSALSLADAVRTFGTTLTDIAAAIAEAGGGESAIRSD